MRRREFIAAAAYSAMSSPLAVLAQQVEHKRKIGVVMDLAGDDPEGRSRVEAFRSKLRDLGWIDGQNVTIEVRWGAGIADRMRKYAQELVAIAPDVILASGSPAVAPLQQATSLIPIVFAVVADPVGAGFVASLARPGGNITGFMLLEYGVAAKWLQLLKEIAPSVRRVAVLRDPTLASGSGQYGAIQAISSSVGVELSPIGLRDASEIERGIDNFAQGANGGLIVTASTLATVHRALIIKMSSKHQLPAVYSNRSFATGGGLLSYTPDRVDQYRQAASYVDRVLRGEPVANLPVQAPLKYELAINLKTAKALGLAVPPTLLARADEVIE